MAKDGARPILSGPKPPLAGAALRKAVMAIWCVCFCGMQWRAIGLLCDIPFGTLYGLFARWTRLGLWRRLLNRLRRNWRRACGDSPEPSAVVIDSRSCRSAPSCFDRGIDGGRKIRGVKIGGVSPNRRKFRQAESGPAAPPSGKTFRISCQIRKDGTPPRTSRRVPSHRIAPHQPLKTGKFPLAGRSAGRSPAWRNFRRLGLTTPSSFGRPGLSRDWRDGDGSDMTEQIVAGWGFVDGGGFYWGPAL